MGATKTEGRMEAGTGGDAWRQHWRDVWGAHCARGKPGATGSKAAWGARPGVHRRHVKHGPSHCTMRRRA